MVEFAVSAFTDILEVALPIALVFEIGSYMVRKFVSIAFGGRMQF